ncbi:MULTISPECIES: VanW family protein [Brevibacillus]|uniref:VanW family protein n=1 Tax=Brevibacillus TaxID=55080 RepID=UPI001D0B4551|nr:VanW family protein [Brevibacillus borstelensis]MCC0564800.1 VanW family protein [Brevibacillus borstelensis]MCM3471053.1 VanW family protein [Brevibacillus borstelensis]MCM3621236.1 VanW family protein [Brevibacillus borstelensis]MED1743680.1 VanW family protein [Brevibacillus borstelensis]MED1850471.1 VanW family protein [Brevibacillus borstelensis]
MRPIKRSRWRLAAGICYYRIKRYREWLFGRKKYARLRKPERLPCLHKHHQTPLLRQLQNVEMWMQHNKVTNLRIASERLDGIVVRPGETFSYWKLIGKPTRRKGYLEGMLLSHGQVLAGVGGGLCQLSNLIYWMTLFTPLTVTERHRHSYDVFPDASRTQPFGSGATCFYNYLDLQIANQTNQAFQLRLSLGGGCLVGEWLGEYPPTRRYEVYEKKHAITPGLWGGYERRNLLYRRVYDLEGELIGDEFIAENRAYMMYEPLLPGREPAG